MRLQVAGDIKRDRGGKRRPNVDESLQPVSRYHRQNQKILTSAFASRIDKSITSGESGTTIVPGLVEPIPATDPVGAR